MIEIVLLEDIKKFKLLDNLYLLRSNCQSLCPAFPQICFCFSLPMSSCLVLLTPTEMCSKVLMGERGQVSDLRRGWLPIIAGLTKVTWYTQWAGFVPPFELTLHHDKMKTYPQILWPVASPFSLQNSYSFSFSPFSASYLVQTSPPKPCSASLLEIQWICFLLQMT